MKKLLQLLIGMAVLMTAVSAEARNLFVPGTQWIRVTDYIGSANPSYCRLVLGDEVVIDGETVMPFYFLSLDEEINPLSVPYVYIRTEGEKVYFRKLSSESSEWYLLYDFGLEIGEEVTVYNAGDPITSRTMKCVDRVDEHYKYGEGKWMIMRIDYGEGYGYEEGAWLDGLGELGIDCLCPAAFSLCGWWTSVCKIISPSGEILYGSGNSGIEDTSDEVTVTESIYTLDGRKVRENAERLAPGIYIKVKGRSVEKIKVF